MPALVDSRYRPPFWLRGGHAQTLFPRLLLRLPWFAVARERITMPDDDSLDLDWTGRQASRLSILSHGLEGCSRSV